MLPGLCQPSEWGFHGGAAGSVMDQHVCNGRGSGHRPSPASPGQGPSGGEFIVQFHNGMGERRRQEMAIS